MPTALIIGASRGIGREFARQYREDGWRVIATARRDDDLSSLGELGCEALKLDVNNAEQCAAFAWKLDDERIDVAVVNAGVYGPRTAALETPMQHDFDTVMHTNVLAAMRLLPVVGPLVANAKGRLAVISSIMGSMAERTAASGWLYRASKAALNSVLVDAARVLGPEGVICVSFHPGWVRTDMGGEGAEIEVDESVAGMRRVLAGLNAQDNGSFYSYDGEPLAW
jgi:NAD(P)-dependent dehydrogenase (short-subunit alcohol dehydrogenase family)